MPVLPTFENQDTAGIETVNVEAPAKKSRRPPYPGLSPLQAGLMYGGAAATVAGPLGIPIGVLFGIAAKRQRDSYLDREAAYVADLQERSGALQEELDREYEQADPDERRLLDHARRLRADGFSRIMAGDTEAGERMLEQAGAVSQGIMQADSAARKADESAAMSFQRQLIGNAAESYRKEYQQTLGDHDTVQTRTARVFDMLSSADFDPNKPLNKAIIGDLITEGMGMYRDTPDAWDAITNKVGGLAGIGLDALGGLMKSQDFKISREDYYRIALNLRQFSDQQAQGKLAQLGNQAKELDGFARKTRSIADDYSLGDYISGGVDELQLLPVPAVAPTPSVVDQAREALGVDTPTEALGTRRLTSGPTTRGRRRAARPVNGGGFYRNGPPL